MKGRLSLSLTLLALPAMGSPVLAQYYSPYGYGPPAAYTQPGYGYNPGYAAANYGNYGYGRAPAYGAYGYRYGPMWPGLNGPPRPPQAPQPILAPAGAAMNPGMRAALMASAQQGFAGVPAPTVIKSTPLVSPLATEGAATPAQVAQVPGIPLDATLVGDGSYPVDGELPAGVDASTLTPGCRFFAFGGFTLLRANPANSTAFTVYNTSLTPPNAPETIATSIRTRRFQEDLVFSPQVMLGFVGPEGFGVRGRWWYFHDTDSQAATNADASGLNTAIVSNMAPPFNIVSSASVGGVNALPAGTGGGSLALGLAPDQFLADMALTLHTADLEAFKMARYGRWSVLGGLGVRYAYMQQNTATFRSNAGGSVTDPIMGTTTITKDYETSAAQHIFNGVGPTLSADVVRSLGDTGLGVYGLGRGSVLLGQHRYSSALTRAVAADFGGGLVNQTILYDSQSETNNVVPVLDLEFGGQYVHDIGRLRLLARAGFQVQMWWDAGDYVSNQGNLDLYGGSFLLGVEY